MKSTNLPFCNPITTIRKKLRTARVKLSKDFQQKNSEIIAEKVIASAIFQQSTNIAIYLPTEGEVATQSIIEAIWKNNKNCFLPRIKSFKEKNMDFISYEDGDFLIKNKYEIPEPNYDERKTIAPQKLDLAIIPLVGFNDAFFRIGLGAGFYDKAFAHKLTSNTSKPFLLGIAHEFQRIDFKPNSWDVPLQVIITER